MKILITGGAGFIGSNIVDSYIKLGHEVIIVDNFSTGQKNNLNPKAKVFDVDINDSRIKKIFSDEKPDILNHHAAQIDVRKSVEDPQFDLKVNVGGLINLLEAAKSSSSLQKIIFASSGGTVYGDSTEFPTKESHSLNPISPYGLNKLASEQYLYYFQHVTQTPFVILRYANVYGPRQNPHGEAGVVAIFIQKMLKNIQPVINGDGKQTRDYVYVDDVVAINTLALKAHIKGIYNVGTGIETDVNALFHHINTLTKKSFEEKHAPAKVGEQLRSVLSFEKAVLEIDWKPKIDLKQGLQKTVEWFQKNQ